MQAVAVTELRNRLDSYLRDVREGEVVLVTDRRRAASPSCGRRATEYRSAAVDVRAIFAQAASTCAELEVSDFAAALAQQNQAPVYTGDPEFKGVAKEVRVVRL